MAKAELRADLKQKRHSLSVDERRKYSEEICCTIMQSDVYKSCDTLLSYFPINDEVDIVPLLNDAIKSNKIVALPKVVSNDILFYRIYSLDNLTVSNMNIPEPNGESGLLNDYSNSICIVPALGIDRNGYRIGYGGGYYDRFLRCYTGISIGVVNPLQYIDSIPIEDHDIKLNLSVIPGKGIIEF